MLLNKKNNNAAVLFDAAPMLDNNKTGIGYYVENIINSLSDEDDNTPLIGYYFNFLNRRKYPEDSWPALSFRKIIFFPSKLLSLCRRLGFQPSLNMLVGKNYSRVLFTNYIALPVAKNVHVTLFIYDLSFMDCPEFLQEVNLKVLKKFCPESIRRADTIITISEFTKERILHYFPDIHAKIVVTPIPPVTTRQGKTELNSRLSGLGIKEKKYFFFLGTIEPRKNIAMLVKAYSQLPVDIRSEYSLVLAGGKGWKDNEIFDEIELAKSSGSSIIQPGYISNDEKDALYSNATSFVMPSHYEGFGMPILEAMSYNTPVILSNIPVFKEVAKEAAIYFNKDDSDDITDKLELIVRNSPLRAELVEKGNEVLENFTSWDENAHKIIETLK
jgi:glycosyltransferase involved in cell wall biosynthesis